MNRDIPNTDPFIEIAEYLGVQEVTPLELIDHLRETGISIETHLGNEHLGILFNRIKAQLESLEYTCTFTINALDSHLYVEDIKVNQLDDIQYLIDGGQSH